jgi:hypothetical protein
MKKLIPLALGILAISACSLKKQTVPGMNVQWASSDYQVLARTNAEECGDYVFIDWAHLFKNQSASIAGGGSPLDIITGLIPSGTNVPEASRALYHALDKVPEATHLISPRVHTTWNGVDLMLIKFGRRCATVEAHGVRIGERPVPNAN